MQSRKLFANWSLRSREYNLLISTYPDNRNRLPEALTNKSCRMDMKAGSVFFAMEENLEEKAKEIIKQYNKNCIEVGRQYVKGSISHSEQHNKVSEYLKKSQEELWDLFYHTV